MAFKKSSLIFSIAAASLIGATSFYVMPETESESISLDEGMEISKFSDSYLDKGDYIKINGDGITVDGKIIKISNGGVFSISGDFENFGINITTEESVELKLKGINLRAIERPAIISEKNGSVTITAVDKTQNFLSGDETSENPLIFTKGNLLFDGGGELGMRTISQNAVYCEGDVSVLNGMYNIYSTEKAAIHAGGRFSLNGGSLAIVESKGGIRSPFVAVNKGSLLIQTDSLDFKTANHININGGALIVLTDDFSDGSGCVNLKKGRIFDISDKNFTKRSQGLRRNKSIAYADNYISNGSKFSVKEENGDILEEFMLPVGFEKFQFVSPELNGNSKYYILKDDKVISEMFPSD